MAFAIAIYITSYSGSSLVLKVSVLQVAVCQICVLQNKAVQIAEFVVL